MRRRRRIWRPREWSTSCSGSTTTLPRETILARSMRCAGSSRSRTSSTAPTSRSVPEPRKTRVWEATASARPTLRRSSAATRWGCCRGSRPKSKVGSRMSKVRTSALGLLLLLALAGGAFAQDTKRPIRLFVPSPPGGPSDFAARLITPGLSEALGRTVVVDARQSVNGVISTEAAAKSPPDGNSLSIGNVGTHVMNTGLYKHLPYDPIRDFTPVGRLVSAGTALVASVKLTPKTFKEFVTAAKSD